MAEKLVYKICGCCGYLWATKRCPVCALKGCDCGGYNIG